MPPFLIQQHKSRRDVGEFHRCFRVHSPSGRTMPTRISPIFSRVRSVEALLVKISSNSKDVHKGESIACNRRKNNGTQASSLKTGQMMETSGFTSVIAGRPSSVRCCPVAGLWALSYNWAPCKDNRASLEDGGRASPEEGGVSGSRAPRGFTGQCRRMERKGQ